MRVTPAIRQAFLMAFGNMVFATFAQFLADSSARHDTKNKAARWPPCFCRDRAEAPQIALNSGLRTCWASAAEMNFSV